MLQQTPMKFRLMRILWKPILKKTGKSREIDEFLGKYDPMKLTMCDFKLYYTVINKGIGTKQT
jgi:hypothetical protein